VSQHGRPTVVRRLLDSGIDLFPAHRCGGAGSKSTLAFYAPSIASTVESVRSGMLTMISEATSCALESSRGSKRPLQIRLVMVDSDGMQCCEPPVLTAALLAVERLHATPTDERGDQRSCTSIAKECTVGVGALRLVRCSFPRSSPIFCTGGVVLGFVPVLRLETSMDVRTEVTLQPTHR
jgi:hypothetical protein